jgi:two-component system CheB/CheR fusion protein
MEVWDTGIGIAGEDLSRIFKEYERAEQRTVRGGFGLGLAIVQRLGELLGHAVGARSQPGKGSVFWVDLPLAAELPAAGRSGPMPPTGPAERPAAGTILVIDDDPAVRRSLEWALAAAGYHVVIAANGQEALGLVGEDAVRPDLIVSDFFLQDRMNGVEATAAVRLALGVEVPAIFLTGDIRQRDIAPAGSILLTKPVKPQDLLRIIREQLAAPRPPAMAPGAAPATTTPATIYVVDDDRSVREATRAMLTSAGYRVETFADGQALLDADRTAARGCVLIDLRMPGMSGLDLLARLAAAGSSLPALLITGYGDVPMAVEAMRAGAVDFIEKPVRSEQLLAAVERALRHAAAPGELSAWRTAASLRLASLTQRERQVMDEVVAGHANKEIAARLGISQRTVETHRANVMKKMGAASLADLVRLTFMA